MFVQSAAHPRTSYSQAFSCIEGGQVTRSCADTKFKPKLKLGASSTIHAMQGLASVSPEQKVHLSLAICASSHLFAADSLYPDILWIH